MFRVPNKFRFRNGDAARFKMPSQAGQLESVDSDGNNGLFIVQNTVLRNGPLLRCIASDGEGWEHVSVSTATRTPIWEEMCLVKDLFWEDEDEVVQYHPAKSDYVNCHPFCLHLWRPNNGGYIVRPPAHLVGPK